MSAQKVAIKRNYLAEDSKNLAEGELNKAGESLNRGIKTADDKINEVNSTIDNTKQEIGGVVNAASSTFEQTKKQANDAINQGVKAAEQAFDDQVKHFEKVNYFHTAQDLITRVIILL